MSASDFPKDEISLTEIYCFFAEQSKTIAMVFLVILALGIGYAATRPTLYMSTASVAIGNALNLDSKEPKQLESPEMVIYKYSHLATIKPIKNTNIVEVSAIAEDRKNSIQNVKLTLNDIITTQNNIYTLQENKFIKYLSLLEITQTTKMQILSALQEASNASATHSSEIVTTELPYSGKIYKILLAAFFIATLAALAAGALKEIIRRARKPE